MALINRMSRLLTADIHAVLDRIEEPDALLRQAIRDMDDELARAEQHLKRLEHERDALIARRRRLDRSLADVDAQLDVCFDAGNDALARKLVRRRLEAERLGRHIAERLDAIEESAAAQRATIVEQRERLDVLRQKAELLTEGAEPAAAGVCDEPGRYAVGDDEVEVAFLRERQRRKPS